MEFTKTNNGFVKYDENGRVIAEITYATTSNPNVVLADHTFVDSSLRGQGVAGKLLDVLVKDMADQNKKIKASCSYVVKKFQEDSSFDFINADKYYLKSRKLKINFLLSFL